MKKKVFTGIFFLLLCSIVVYAEGSMFISETLNPDTTAIRVNVTVYGHLDLSNGTDVVDNVVSIWLNGTLLNSAASDMKNNTPVKAAGSNPYEGTAYTWYSTPATYAPGNSINKNPGNSYDVFLTNVNPNKAYYDLGSELTICGIGVQGFNEWGAQGSLLSLNYSNSTFGELGAIPYSVNNAVLPSGNTWQTINLTQPTTLRYFQLKYSMIASYTGIAEVVYYNCTSPPIKTNSSGDYSFTFAAPSSEGVYPVKVNATYSGLYAENTKNLTVYEPPAINWINATPDPCSVNGILNITANISDNKGISSVWVTINNTNYTMSNAGGNIYYNSSIDTSKYGLFAYTVYARDTDNYLSSASSSVLIMRLFISETLSPNVASSGSNVTVYGHLNLSNGTDVADTIVNIYLNETAITGATDYINPANYPRAIYVDVVNGNDTTGNGSILNPFKTFNKSVENATNGALIYIKPGNYTTTYYQAHGGGGQAASIVDLGKNLTIYARPGTVKFIFNGFQSPGRDAHAVTISNAGTKVIGIIFDFDAGTRYATYERSVFGNAADVTGGIFHGTIYNCHFIVRRTTSFMYANSDSTNSYVNNSQFQLYAGLESPYSGSISAGVNDAFNASSSSVSSAGFGTCTTCLYNVNYTSDYHINVTGWRNNGTGTNPDGTQANIGVYGGTYMWVSLTPTTTNSSGDYSFTFAAPSNEGIYPVKVNATYSGLYAENTKNLTVYEPPAINWINATPDPCSVNGILNITANISDNKGVSSVWVTINNTNYTMSNAGGNIYYNSSIDTSKHGLFAYTVYARDTDNYLSNASSSVLIMSLVISETLSPGVASPGSNVTVYGHLNLSNATNIADTIVNIFLNNTILLPPSYMNISGGTGGGYGEAFYAASDGTNISSTAPSYANGPYYILRYLFDLNADGDPLHYWLTYGGSIGAEALKFKFNETKYIKYLSISPKAAGDGRYLSFYMQKSMDGSTWTNISNSDVNGNAYSVGQFVNITVNDYANYIRLIATSYGLWGYSLGEVEIFAGLPTITTSSGDYNFTFTAPSTIGIYPIKVNLTYGKFYSENTKNLAVLTSQAYNVTIAYSYPANIYFYDNATGTQLIPGINAIPGPVLVKLNNTLIARYTLNQDLDLTTANYQVGKDIDFDGVNASTFVDDSDYTKMAKKEIIFSNDTKSISVCNEKGHSYQDTTCSLPENIINFNTAEINATNGTSKTSNGKTIAVNKTADSVVINGDLDNVCASTILGTIITFGSGGTGGPTVPEFSTIGILLALLVITLALGFLILRKHK